MVDEWLEMVDWWWMMDNDATDADIMAMNDGEQPPMVVDRIKPWQNDG